MTAVTMEMVLGRVTDAGARMLLGQAVRATLEEAREAEARERERAERLRIEQQALYATTFRIWVDLLPAELRRFARRATGGELALLRKGGEQQVVDLVFPGLELPLRACVEWAGGAKVGIWRLYEYRMPTVDNDVQDGRKVAVVNWSQYATTDNADWALCDLVRTQAELLELRARCEAWNRENGGGNA